VNVARRLVLASVVGASMQLTACQPAVQEVRIVAQEFRFEPAQIQLRAAEPVHLVIVNEGRELHEFTSTLLANPLVRTLAAAKPAEYREAASFKIPPGRSVEITLLAPPGVYAFYCKIKGHSGMAGTIMVE
jgi:uncharacterized cupredoxin-like copper-binding protein